jgi:hypothetical protein
MEREIRLRGGEVGMVGWDGEKTDLRDRQPYSKVRLSLGFPCLAPHPWIPWGYVGVVAPLYRWP